MPGGRIDIEVAPDLTGFPGKLQSGLKASSGLASTLGKGLGLAIAAGTAVAAVGLKSVLDIGIEYTNQLNTLQSVTHATGLQMAQVGTLAKQLGADMSLPATSAADAAAAMTELAKGGLSVDQAMTAAKGTLQLAAAAQVEAARAAEIQSDALNQFGLSADNAGHVADVLANTANAASGEITDMAAALKYVGPVARGLSIDIDNTATAIGLLATAGIRGEQAGTSLRGIIASLASPSKPATAALKELGVVAFDVQGKFVGLRTFTDQLAQAKGRLSEADFAAAASTAFGNEGFTAANALAQAGAAAFDDMAKAVGRAGGASDVAAAKTKGLGGAWEGLKSQLETTGIEIFEAIDGPLEQLVRSASGFVDEFGGQVAAGIEKAIVAGQTFGPKLAEAIKARASVVGAAVKDVLGPVAVGSVGILNTALNAGIGLWNDFTGVLDNAVQAVRPVAAGVAAVAQAANEASGPVSAVASGIGLAGDAAGAASTLLIPLGKLIGIIAQGFAGLPGPIQTAVVALGLVAAFKGPLGSLGDTVRDRVTFPFRVFADTMRLQAALATGEVGKLGLATAALEKHVPVVGRMADAFRSASTSARAWTAEQHALTSASGTLAGTLRGAAPAFQGIISAAAGTASAVGVGLKGAFSGLVGFLGGPWGIALAAAGVGLSLLAKNQQEAAQKASEHKQQLSELQSTLDRTSGSITQQTRELLANRNATDGVNDAAKRQKIDLKDLLEAQTGNGKALTDVNDKLRANAKEYVTSSDSAKKMVKVLDDVGISFDDLTEVAVGNQAALKKVQAAIDGVRMGDTQQALKAFLKDVQNGSGDLSKLGGAVGGANNDIAEMAKRILDAQRALGGSSPFVAGLASAMDTLASKTASASERASALKRALDILSGGEIGLTAAQAEFNRQVDAANESLSAGTDHAKGWGDQIIGASGKLSVATKNGQDFQRSADGITGALLNVATATFDVSKNAGDTLPQSFEKVKKSVQESRDKLIDLAVNGYGVARADAEKYADQLGLIPDIVATQVTTGGSAPAVTKEVAEVLKGLTGLPKDTPVHVTALTDEARKLLLDLGYRIETMPDGQVDVYANTGPAQGAVDKLIRDNNGRVIGIRVNVGGVEGVKIGGPNVASYYGNLVPAQRFATGGLAAARPFKAGTAQKFPPRMLRFTGDRSVDDEYYIPDNNDPRSLALLSDLARRRGFELIRAFAMGGVAQGSGTAQASLSLNGMSITGRLRMDMDGYGTLIDARIQQSFDNTAREVQLRRGRTQ